MTGRADTCAHRGQRAIAFIRNAGGWVPAKDVCQFLGLSVEQVSNALASAIAAGEIDRQHVQGGSGGSKLSWRIAEPKPTPPKFSIDWPPQFVPRFDAVKLPAYEARAK